MGYDGKAWGVVQGWFYISKISGRIATILPAQTVSVKPDGTILTKRGEI
jgi:hypothetical protein